MHSFRASKYGDGNIGQGCSACAHPFFGMNFRDEKMIMDASIHFWNLGLDGCKRGILFWERNDDDGRRMHASGASVSGRIIKLLFVVIHDFIAAVKEVAIALEKFEVRSHHFFHQLVKRAFMLPAKFCLSLCWITNQ